MPSCTGFSGFAWGLITSQLRRAAISTCLGPVVSAICAILMRLEPARQRYMSQGMPAWWHGDTLLFRQHGEVHKHDDARRSDQHASQHQSSSPMHASPRHPPAAAVPTVGAARRSDAGGPVNQAPPSGAIAATSPPPGPTLPPPPPNPPVASSSMATHVPRPSYAHANSASPPSGPPSRQRRRPNRA